MSCPNDTDHDGDCHLCHRLPGGCFLRGITTPVIHCGSSISKTEVLFSGSTDPFPHITTDSRRFLRTGVSALPSKP